ncbi:hypothetical protein C9374_013370 [Naegleria lovaniensis]|uniref:Lipid desaturase domain-containing protein n=1 Tax=Naegleria lovaniensis TaxID=51637 RepID=A0AA88KVE2_NAELO|nr:uncharacterized protein C9374_013370 [Naegleria lovaniensis]KAG2391885.1 hypothetical protein C9374_013370 [Naegleria lovaniensis]
MSKTNRLVSSSSTPGDYDSFIKAKEQKEQVLKSGYSSSKRAMEYFFVLLYFCVILPWNLYQSFAPLWFNHNSIHSNINSINSNINSINSNANPNSNPNSNANIHHSNIHTTPLNTLLLDILGGIVLGMITTDFVSGILHWIADTWGSLETPLIGQTFIRSFREHHVAPSAMCKHDFIETNGDNCLVATVLGIIPIIFFRHSMFMSFYFTAFALLGAFTNQIHKWSHQYQVPPIVKFLQSSGIILSRTSHNFHHKSPFDTYYCITTGWLNYPLHVMNFWRSSEKLVTWLTGYLPRSDDMKWTSHLKYLETTLKDHDGGEDEASHDQVDTIKKKN